MEFKTRYSFMRKLSNEEKVKIGKLCCELKLEGLLNREIIDVVNKKYKVWKYFSESGTGYCGITGNISNLIKYYKSYMFDLKNNGKIA